MFNSIRNLESINYLMLLKDKKCEYSNSEINKIYNIENRKYGNNIKIDSENYDKNNIEEISKQIKNKLLDVEPNENNIIQSLVKHLYEKPSSRKKKLLWYMYGDKILENIKENIDTETEVCMKCGKRVSKGKLVRNQCSKCRELEIKQNNGKKIIKCVDCGKEFEVESMSRIERCNDCKEKRKKEQKRIEMKKYRDKYKM